ncbi:alkyl hydroperoxide reductase subunit F [Leeia sp. TBRC 13508]|uniref:Alkyl hydroperoxide reductase subunit F n=1 Tax=Leeia speluncae TaxID=2884804 RepID=A0ABS8D3W6_9NEIS|nr:alkyl hydroperoxide reductase subunit F [Leeia speluncae]MCB6182869.1 alkyl hydroperoxide reductase subunit F [Leeia speluncae]
MLDNAIKQQLTAYMANLVFHVELVASLDDSAKSQEVRQLLDDIASISNKVSVRLDGTDNRKPSFSVARQGNPARITFAGVPMGHEFTSLVLALLHSGGHPSKASTSLIEQIQGLDGDYAFETYVSLSCQNCPDVVQALNLMATLNPRIRHTMIDGALFQAEVEAKQIMSVPTVYLNGASFGQGRMSAEEIVAKLDTGLVARESAKINEKAPFDVLVVGGGPAGASAAIYAARKGIRTGVVAERFGGQVLDTVGIENFISVKETEGPKLATALEQHVTSYNVDIMNLQRAAGMSEKDGLIEVRLESGATLRSKSVVVATGARWRELNVPGEQAYRGKGVAYCPHCDGPLFKGKRVAVVGGGNSGVEAAIDLAGIVEHVTLLEFGDSLRADAVLQDKLRSLSNATIITRAQTTEVLGDGQKMTGMTYTDRTSGESQTLDVAGVFVQIGLLPNTDWLKGSVELNGRGEVVTGSHQQTSLSGVFAAGDVTDVPYKQIIVAMGEGAKAALGAFDHLIRQTPVAA